MNSSYMLERRAREAQIRTHINQKMDEAGERERLKELLRKRLKECGWRDQLKEQCKEVIREKGLDHVTVETLVAEMTQFARSSVPEGVKRELLQEIRDFVQSQQ